MSSHTLGNIIASIVVAAFLAGLVALYLAANLVCHRVTGPWVTGSNDPLVITTYCRSGK